MLVLTRKSREAVAVGAADGRDPLLKVTVLAISHGSVKLGFEATGEVPVHRWEVWERIQLGLLPSKPVENLETAIAF